MSTDASGSPAFDPVAATEAAHGFRNTARLIEEARRNKHADFSKAPLTVELVKEQVALGISATVLHALAVELILKTRIHRETGKAPRGHDLGKLFSTLPLGAQQEAQNRYDSHRRFVAIHSTIQEALTRHASTFVEWRYPHERIHEGVSPMELDRAFLALAEGL